MNGLTEKIQQKSKTSPPRLLTVLTSTPKRTSPRYGLVPPVMSVGSSFIHLFRVMWQVATVNTNMRGELVGQKSSEGADSIAIGGRIQAGKLAQESRSVNDNVRGELAGTFTHSHDKSG